MTKKRAIGAGSLLVGGGLFLGLYLRFLELSVPDRIRYNAERGDLPVVLLAFAFVFVGVVLFLDSMSEGSK